MKGIIYKATSNYDGRVYIGQTITSLRHRRAEHEKDSKGVNDWNYFHTALYQQNYDFEWEVIDTYEGDADFVHHALNVAEEYHIIKYRSAEEKYGYNSTYGGYSSDKYAKHYKVRRGGVGAPMSFWQYDLDGNFIREWRSLREISDAFNRPKLKAKDLSGQWRGFQWRPKVGDHRPTNIGKYEMAKKPTVRVAVYDIKGDFVKVFEKYIDVAKELGYSPQLRDDFSKEVVISDNRKGDFLCYRIPDGGYPQKVNTRIKEKHQPKPSQLVVCDRYDLEGKFVTRYSSLVEAWRHTGVTIGTIRDWCKKEEPLRITGQARMLWRYGRGEIRPQIEVIPFIRKEEYREKMEHRVLQYSLKGEYIATFNRIQEAADASGDSYGLIRKQCQGGRVRETKFQWRYYTDDYPLEIPKFTPIPKSAKVGRPRKSTYSPGQQTLF